MKRFSVVLLLLLSPALYAQTPVELKAAHYYDLDGKKIHGFVDTTFSTVLKSKYVLFAESVQGDRRHIKAAKIQSIVTTTDSVVILQNFNVEMEASNRMFLVPVGVSRVITAGEVTLYDVYYRGNVLYAEATYGPKAGNYRHTYLLKQRGSDRLTFVEVDLNDFIVQMSAYFRMSQEIYERIQKKEYSYRKLPELVTDYNTWYKNRKP